MDILFITLGNTFYKLSWNNMIIPTINRIIVGKVFVQYTSINIYQ